MHPRISLPIDPLLPEIVASLGTSSSLVVTATPGSGKTTRVPFALLPTIPGKIYVLEPRRLAARLSAERVAEENGIALGRDVGYQFRFEKKREDSTRLVFLTEGMLMRELLSNPTLKGVGCVILDEFHERHLQGDLAIAVLKRLQSSSRPDLKVVVMSATLEAEPLLAYLPNSRQIDVPGARFPIETKYLMSDAHLDLQVKRAVQQLLAEPDSEDFGDILVFLPGMAEIRRAEAALSEVRGIEVTPLHGELTKEEQSRALKRFPHPKVILATNIAESSLTIPGVNTVIDSGLSRVASFSHWSGVPRLATKPISRASATQRAGRAGRTGPGRVLRLYSKGDFEGRPFADLPEMKRSDLSQPCLELLSLGVASLGEFPWFEAPSGELLKSTLKSLWRLGAVDLVSEASLTADITQLGRRLLEMPLPPKLSRTLIEAEKLGVSESALDLVTALSEGRDLGLDALEGIEKLSKDPHFSRIRDRVSRVLRGSPKDSAPVSQRDGLLAQSLLTGYSDRVAMKRGRELLLSQGGSIETPESTVFQGAEFFLVLDVMETKTLDQTRAKARVKSVCAIESDWLLGLEPEQVEEKNELLWSDSKKRWFRSELLIFQGITLSSKLGDVNQGSVEPGLLIPKLCTEWFAGALVDVKKREEFASLESRYRLAKRAFPDRIPGESLRGLLTEEFAKNWAGETGVSDLPELETAMQIWIPPEVAKELERIAPLTVDLAHRKKVRVIYEEGQPPRVESRLQDFFGMKEGPTWMAGQKKISLHLLAPNYRAVQVTEDLSGFWVRHYPGIRKELMRRYPRHKWPEDPMKPGDLTK